MAEVRQIILADNQDVTRLGLKTIIRGALSGVENLVVKELSRRAELIAELKENPSSVVVIDYTLFDLGSADELLNLSERFPFALWVLFSEDLTEGLIRRLSVEQQFSMVLKTDSAQEIITALKCAVTGVRFLCHQVTNLLLTPHTPIEREDQLTATEREVLRLIALGKSVKEIAAERNSSIHTITTHKKNIFRKIRVNTVYEATKYALRAGLVEMVEYYI
ncbi:MAG: response regulator transcription factor [Bacteroidaceae bacterium]|nr:response regulator transcription factor [Bacteroidaceae bacterium]